jgi:CTP:molybdopterin cytidylyltransferase MocA
VGITAVVLAGDRKFSKNVLGQNKALLDLEGRPILFHVLSALDEAKEIDAIYVVGPKALIEDRLDAWDRETPLTIMEQKENALQNAMSAFIRSLPGDTDKIPEAVLEKKYADHPILVVTADIPLLTGAEVDHFISHADFEQYDMIMGGATEEVMKKFYPTETTPGIHLAYFHMKDVLFRQSNIFLVRPFQVKNLKYIHLMYAMRYQKQGTQALKLALTLLKLTRGSLIILFDFLVLQLTMHLARLGLTSLVSFTRRLTNLNRLCRHTSRILGTRLIVIENPLGGATLDTDNDDDYRAMQQMFKTWKAEQRRLGQDL